ncbi:MAG TPA: histidine kinase dimerization/phospho-acceptor domain-containing protein, partial [Micromonosporaceae bacterium]|nr:histidine kinase dimerization/phospho-acceptor domain-containing protein [Micromonosporaceae bacterium]
MAAIRTRVTLYGLGVVALVLAVISVLFGLLVLGSVPQTQDKELATRAASALDGLASAPPDRLSQPAGPVLTPVDGAVSDEIFVLVLDNDGQLIASTGGVDGQSPTIPAGVLTRAGSVGRAAATVAAGGLRLRVYVRPWQRTDLGRSGFVVAAQSLRRQQTDRRGLVAVLILSDLIALIAASVGIWLVAGRALRPLRELTAMADEIGQSTDLGRRLPEVRSRDDVGRLTASFNAMMARLQEAYGRIAAALAAQQRFTADASHELRTPLTTIRNNAGFLRTHPEAKDADRTAALADIDAEAARMARLVDDLLTLARADGGQHLTMSTVELGALAHEVCRQARGLHTDREIHCAGAPVAVLGDAEALRRLLWILLDNAVAHTGSGGTVWVAVIRHGAAATLQVSDDGDGVPAGLEGRV